MKRKSIDQVDEPEDIVKRVRTSANLDRLSALSDEVLLEVLNKLDAEDLLILQRSRGLKYAGADATWTQNYRLNYNWANGIFRQRYVKVGDSALSGRSAALAYNDDWAYVVVLRPHTCIWDLRMYNLKNGTTFHDRLRDDLVFREKLPPTISLDTGSETPPTGIHRFAVTWPDASVRICSFNSTDFAFKKKLHKLRGPTEQPRAGPPKAAYMHPYYAQFTTQPTPQLRLIMFSDSGEPVILHRMSFIPDPSAMHLQWRKVAQATALCAVWSIPLRRDNGRSIAVQEFRIPDGQDMLKTSSAISSTGLSGLEINLDDLPLETQFILNYTHPYVTLCNQGDKTCRYTLCTDDTRPEARVKIDIPYNLYAYDSQIQGEAKVNEKGRVVTKYAGDLLVWEAEDAYTRHFHPSGRREKVMDICVKLRPPRDPAKLIAMAVSKDLKDEPQSASQTEKFSTPTLSDFCRPEYSSQSLNFDDARIVTLNVCSFQRRGFTTERMLAPCYLEVLDFDFFMRDSDGNI